MNQNPNTFLRTYAERKYGKEYVENHVCDADEARSGRTNAPESVVSDLKSKKIIFCVKSLILCLNAELELTLYKLQINLTNDDFLSCTTFWKNSRNL